MWFESQTMKFLANYTLFEVQVSIPVKSDLLNNYVNYGRKICK